MSDLMVQWPVVLAAALSFAWCLVHLFLGGREIVRPLREAEHLDQTVMATLWMCWHMVTVTLFLMGVFFVMGVIWGTAYVVAGTMLSGVIAAAGIAAAPLLGTSFKVLPQGWLFVPIFALGLYALL